MRTRRSKGPDVQQATRETQGDGGETQGAEARGGQECTARGEGETKNKRQSRGRFIPSTLPEKKTKGNGEIDVMEGNKFSTGRERRGRDKGGRGDDDGEWAADKKLWPLPGHLTRPPELVRG